MAPRGGGKVSAVGRGFEGPGEGAVEPLTENCSLLTLEKAHFGGYLMHFDVLVKSWFAVHRMLQGCATDYDNAMYISINHIFDN